MSPHLREGLQRFIAEFEERYAEDLEEWVGIVDTFEPEWIVKRLYECLNYSIHLPLRIDTHKKLKGSFKKTFEFLKTVLDENGEFKMGKVIRDVAKLIGRTEPEALEHLLSMIERGLITPIDIPTFMHREGCGILADAGLQEMEPTSPDEVDTSEVLVTEPPEEMDEEVESEDEPTLDEIISEDVEEESELEEKIVETEEEVQEPAEEPIAEEEPEPEEESDSREGFLSDVEKLLKEKEENDE